MSYAANRLILVVLLAGTPVSSAYAEDASPCQHDPECLAIVRELRQDTHEDMDHIRHEVYLLHTRIVALEIRLHRLTQGGEPLLNDEQRKQLEDISNGESKNK